MKRTTIAALLSLLALAMPAASFAGKQAGGIIIGGEPNFSTYVVPELQTMRADVVKFHLSYDGNWSGGYPSSFAVPASYLNAAISAGARDLIVRTQETRLGVSELNHFMAGMRFSDTGERLIDYIYNHRAQVHVWVEVGNEPDLHGADPYVQRYWLIQIANQVRPQYTYLFTLHWIASLPAAASGSYVDIFYSTASDGNVQSKYDSLGAHEYANQNFSYAVINRALSVLPAGKTIWVTEAGINDSVDWGTKGSRYKAAVQRYAGDGRIRGWTFFLLSQTLYWNRCPNPDNTCLRYGIDLYYNSTTQVPGRPCAAQLATR
jgi:hypothetical protein